MDFPRLQSVTDKFMRNYLLNYGSYVRELGSRARQVINGCIFTKAVCLVAINYRIEVGYLESLISLRLIPTQPRYDNFEDADMWKYLEIQITTSKTPMSVETTDRIIKHELRMDMCDRNAVSRMRNLLLTNYTLLRNHGIECVTEEILKIAAQHIITVV